MIPSLNHRRNGSAEGQPNLGREGFAEHAEEIDPAVGREHVDQLVGQRAHHGLERGEITFGAVSGLRYRVYASVAIKASAG